MMVGDEARAAGEPAAPKANDVAPMRFPGAHLSWILTGVGLATMYVPTLWRLFSTIWATDEQGQGPIVLGLSIWLIWRNWSALVAQDGSRPQPALAWMMMIVAGVFYTAGRSQSVLILEVGSLIPMLIGLVTLFRGFGRLKAVWFPLFFMLFMLPLPGPLVAALTQPMKMAVSSVAEQVLYWAGYPIARTGVMIQIGQYRLLVADACAGLHTLFVLEAIGLLYLNVVQSSSAIRNVALAILIVPISFLANSIRVITLTLVTFYYGDEAGQGFVHGFAGFVLFASALLLLISIDSLLRAASIVARNSRGRTRSI